MKEILNEVKNMVVKQISVFIENKEGRMKKAINTLAQENINIRALSIADTTKYGILRLIVSDNEKAIEALEKDGFIVREDDVIIVAVPDEPNGLNTTLAIFDEKRHQFGLPLCICKFKNRKSYCSNEIETYG